MLSTRNVGAKGDEESNFATSKGEVAEDDDSRGYHHTSYKRDGSSDYKRWLVYILTTAVAGYFLWSCLISPKAQSLIELDTAPFKLTTVAQTDSIRKISDQERDLAENPLNVKPLLQNQPDAMGCYHSVPEIDLGKHIVPPPSGPIKLVCCQSTKGPLNIAVHDNWAPIGAERFLKLVEMKWFSSQIAMFRAVKNFLVQFGLNGDADAQDKFERSEGRGGLPDDPNWLPEGPSGREINGIKRFRKGYLAYAGGGKNSRGTQLIMAFQDNLYLGGGSPWEVPFAQLVGENSFETLGKFYTGYGDDVSQTKLRNRGLEYTKSEFPLLDYITSCDLIAVDLPWKTG